MKSLKSILFASFFIGSLQSYSQKSEVADRRFTFSITTPLINNYHIMIADSAHKNDSYFGLIFGAGYYFNEKNYLDLHIGMTVSNELPVPMAVEYEGAHDSYSSLFADFTTNHVVHGFLQNRLHYSVGLNYTRYIFNSDYEVMLPNDSVAIENLFVSKNTMGGTAGLKFRVVHHWLIGAKINASFYEFDDHTWEYNHIAYLEIIFRFWSRKD